MKSLIIGRSWIRHAKALLLAAPDIVEPASRGLRRVVHPVDKPAYFVRFPLDHEVVELPGEAPGRGKAFTVSRPLGPFQAVVHRAVDLVAGASGFEANRLHDIDLAAGRPTAVDPVGRQHPNRRPHTLAAGQPGAGFDSAILELEQVFGS